MAQKFQLDPKKPSSEQIRKTEFKFSAEGTGQVQGTVCIHYHYEEGQIFKKPIKIDRVEIIQNSKMGDMNEKDAEKDNEESKKQQFFKKISDMENKCHS